MSYYRLCLGMGRVTPPIKSGVRRDKSTDSPFDKLRVRTRLHPFGDFDAEEGEKAFDHGEG